MKIQTGDRVVLSSGKTAVVGPLYATLGGKKVYNVGFAFVGEDGIAPGCDEFNVHHKLERRDVD